MAEEYRVFRHTDVEGNERVIRVRNATQEELHAADLELSAAFNDALLEGGLPPRQRMLRLLKEKGLWTREDETRLNTLREKLTRLNREVTRNRFESEEAKQEANSERNEVFQQFNECSKEINDMLEHTCDAKADEAHRKFLLCCVTEEVEVDGQGNVVRVQGRLWPQTEDYDKEDDFQLQQRCIYEFLYFNAGVESNWEKEIESPRDGEDEPAAETSGPAPASVTPPTEEEGPVPTDADGESGTETGEGSAQDSDPEPVQAAGA